MTLTHLMATRPVRRENQLLTVLPEEVKERITPGLERVSLPLGDVVYEAGHAQRYVYFPHDSIVSMLSVIESGKCAEVAVVGNEGIVGIDVLMGGSNPCSQAVVQSAGTAYRMPARLLKEQFNRHPALQSLLLRYLQSLLTQMSQTAVCSQHHGTEQRLCRRLLLSLDRSSGDELVLTQAQIAHLLGLRREGITQAAGRLRKLGVIESSRGRIKVLNRDKLERLSCECYAVVKAESDRLLPYTRACHPRHDAHGTVAAPLSSASLASRKPVPGWVPARGRATVLA